MICLTRLQSTCAPNWRATKCSSCFPAILRPPLTVLYNRRSSKVEVINTKHAILRAHLPLTNFEQQQQFNPGEATSIIWHRRHPIANIWHETPITMLNTLKLARTTLPTRTTVTGGPADGRFYHGKHHYRATNTTTAKNSDIDKLTSTNRFHRGAAGRA